MEDYDFDAWRIKKEFGVAQNLNSGFVFGFYIRKIPILYFLFIL